MLLEASLVLTPISVFNNRYLTIGDKATYVCISLLKLISSHELSGHITYLCIELLCSGGAHSMDALEHCNHLLLLLVHLVEATQVPARDNLVDLVGQSFSHKGQTSSLLCVVKVKCVN